MNIPKSKQCPFLVICHGFWQLYFLSFIFFLVANENLNIAQATQCTSPGHCYQKAKEELVKLQNTNTPLDPKAWIALSNTFFTIYTTAPDWINRPFAMYYAGVTLEELAKRSGNPSHAKKALQYYETVLKQYPKRTIAEKTLFNIATIHTNILVNHELAKKYFTNFIQQYPNSEKIVEAQTYLKTIENVKTNASKKINTTTVQKNTQEPKDTDQKNKITPSMHIASSSALLKNQKKDCTTLENITWEYKKDVTKILFVMDKPIQWDVTSIPANEKEETPNRLIISLYDTMPQQTIKPGIKIKEGLLKKIRVDVSTRGITKVLADFSSLKAFKVETANNPFRIAVYASPYSNGLYNSSSMGTTIQSKKTLNSANANLPKTFAQQLGLGVKTILIDPGHGGKDPGAISNGITESIITLELAKALGKELSQKGFKVYYTRTNDSWISLGARTRKANTVKADLMISIHINSSENQRTNGVETYYLDFARNAEAMKLACIENASSERTLSELEPLIKDLMKNARTQESRKLAEIIHKETMAHLIKENYKPRDGGIRSAPLHVLMGSKMPGILIEVGYCSNKAEAKLLSSSNYKTALIEGMTKGILLYSGTLQN